MLKAAKPVKLDGNWSCGVWASVKAVDVKHYMGMEPEHKPKTQAKVLYDDKFIYIGFRVEDKYIRAVSQNYHDSVCKDSCVEFFFTHGTDISLGYFNKEINCGEMILFHYHSAPGIKVVSVSDSDCDKGKICHSEPEIVESENKSQLHGSFNIVCQLIFWRNTAWSQDLLQVFFGDRTFINVLMTPHIHIQLKNT